MRRFTAGSNRGFVVLLREILDGVIENLDTGQTELTGRLEIVRDVLIVDATIISLYQDARDVYASDDDRAGAKFHLTESFSTGLPTRFQTTGASTHERSQLSTLRWVAGALILFDLGYYDFWVFDRADANDGWFVFRIKDNVDFEIVEELRTW